MVAAANMVEVAALVGDTARATILAALMGGQALTGSELAFLARISRSTASEHLTKLVAARLIAVTKRRRYCYYRIASPLVATMLESMKAVAAIEMPPRYTPRSAQDEALRFARTCYDHLAGRLGVAIADALVSRGYVVLTADGGEVTDAGSSSSADPAWIGASADIISLVSWARRSGDDAWSWVGWSEGAIPARCASPPRDVPVCARHSVWTPLNSSKRNRRSHRAD